MFNGIDIDAPVVAGCSNRGAAVVIPAIVLACAQAAAQTPAGTPIVNVAAVRDAAAASLASNPVTLIVAERLDCTLARGEDVPSAVTVLLTNTGNGQEAFAVTATEGDVARPIRVDADGTRRDLADGATSALPPGGTLRLWIPVDTDATSTLTVTARALTGSGAPGTPFTGAGDAGADAVVGATGAAARLTITRAADAPPSISETQAVDGGTTPIHGAIVTYTIVARFVVATPAASIVDPVPAGTAYLPASLTLDGSPVPDAGHVADGQVAVPLGAVAAGAVHRLVFKVVIQ